MTSWVITPSPDDRMVVEAFEDFDPAAVDAVKDLLTRDDDHDRVSPTTESGPGGASTPRGPASTCEGGS